MNNLPQKEESSPSKNSKPVDSRMQSNNFVQQQMNDQSRAFIQSSIPLNNQYPMQLNDQSRAFIQLGPYQQSNFSFGGLNQASQPIGNPYVQNQIQYPSNMQQQQPYYPSYPNQGWPNRAATLPTLSTGHYPSMFLNPQTSINLDHLKYDDDEALENNVVKTNQSEQTENLDQNVKLSMRIKRKIVQSSSFNEQILPMLVSFEVGNQNETQKVPIDLVCVIDHSGSMNGEKIELVKNTFNYLLEYLNASDRLCIIIFDDKASRLVPFVRAAPENKVKILSALKTVRGNGGTDINLGMAHAFHALKQRRYINKVTSIFLLSDGLDGGAQQKVKASLSKFGISEDVTINTFGYGKDHDPQLMTDIADLRDGNFYFIKQLNTVDECFVDCLGGLVNSIAQSAQIKIKAEPSTTLPEVKITKAYGDSSMWTVDNNQIYITKMATVMAGKQKDYVLEIRIPPNSKELQDHEKSIKVATAEATVTLLNGKQSVKQVELYITLLNEIEEVKEEEGDDREVMKNFYRVKGAQLFDEARKMADEKKNEEAKKLLQNFKEEIANSFLKEEQFIKNMIQDLEKVIQYLNPVVYQEYGRQNIYSNQRAQMQQRSDISMTNTNQVYAQMTMTEHLKVMKSAKPGKNNMYNS